MDEDDVFMNTFAGLAATIPRAARLRLLVVAAVLCVCLGGTPALAQQLVLSNLVLDSQGSDIALHFSLRLEGAQEIETMLQQGVLLALDCNAELRHKRGYWLDEVLTVSNLWLKLRGDPVTREFVLELPGYAPLRDSSLVALLNRGWAHIYMNLGPFAQLVHGQEYVIALSVSLRQTDIPAWMRYTLFFKEWEAAPRADYRMSFTY